MQVNYVLDSLVHVKFPPRRGKELSIAVVYKDDAERRERDLYLMLDAVRHLLEADLGRP